MAAYVKYNVENQNPGTSHGMPLPLHCPHCNRNVTFDPLGQDLGLDNQHRFGQRVCTNANCRGHLFVVITKNNKLIKSYPAVRIDFNVDRVPVSVCKSFEEALDCHANGNFTASAIMVRRTLEDICHDRGAAGKNLEQRLKELGSKIVLPKELIDGMDVLRLLGNDAAHVEAKTFNDISDAELTLAIEFTKEIIKGIYQYAELLAKFEALKKLPLDPK